MRLPEIDLSRFHIENISQKLEHSSWNRGINSIITIKLKLICEDGSSGPIDHLYSRKHLAVYGREDYSDEDMEKWIKHEAKRHLMWFLEHEVQECLFFDGVRYEDPHPEQTHYKKRLEEEEKRRAEREAVRKAALEKHEREVAEMVAAKYLDMKYESRDYKLSMFSYQQAFENFGRPQGKSQFFFFDELFAATQEKSELQKAIDQCLDQKTKQTQETSTEVKYLSEPQTVTPDTLIAMKFPKVETSTMMQSSQESGHNWTELRHR